MLYYIILYYIMLCYVKDIIFTFFVKEPVYSCALICCYSALGKHERAMFSTIV